MAEARKEVVSVEEKRRRGRPKKKELAEKPRVVSIHIPKEMNIELTKRAKERGLPLSGYVRFALFVFMQREAAEEAELQARIAAAREATT